MTLPRTMFGQLAEFERLFDQADITEQDLAVLLSGDGLKKLAEKTV